MNTIANADGTRRIFLGRTAEGERVYANLRIETQATGTRSAVTFEVYRKHARHPYHLGQVAAKHRRIAKPAVSPEVAALIERVWTRDHLRYGHLMDPADFIALHMLIEREAEVAAVTNVHVRIDLGRIETITGESYSIPAAIERTMLAAKRYDIAVDGYIVPEGDDGLALGRYSITATPEGQATIAGIG